MINAGLITFHFAHHYGAQLQAYATMRAVRALGASCEIIDYRLPHTTRTNKLFKATGAVRDLVSDAHTALHYGAFKARFDRFHAFVNEQMSLSAKRYTSFDELEADPPAYDVYIAGSDQIWNPFIYQDQRFDPAFLLAFSQEGRKISYAPSLGVPHLPEDRAAELAAYLAPFSALSAREKRGQVLIQEIADREARVVLDPTLLLTGAEWGELAVPPKGKDPYILCYFVSDPGEVAPYAQELSRRTGYPIVQLAGARRKIPGASRVVFDAGPREFLGLFQNADYVCTNSFHGAVFSLQFDRPFFTSMSPKERAEPTFARIYSLLDRLGAADRIVGLETTAKVGEPMDYGRIHKNLTAARADSLSYLKAALEGTAIPADTTPVLAAFKGPKLCAPDSCTGCTACATVCPVGSIAMAPDREGFLRPVVDDNCILCRKCEQVCPGLVPNRPEIREVPVYAVWNADRETRKESTSGGIFSVLAQGILEQGGVIFGAAFDDTLNVCHRKAETWEELALLRQTKYVQSDLGETFAEVRRSLQTGRKVLFTGTACQVDGLKRYLGGEHDLLLTCDLICHGVPSPGVYRAWRKGEEARAGAKVSSLLFRDKSSGWGVGKAVLTLAFENGVRRSAPLVDTTFGRGFGAALFLRPCCHRCPYAGSVRPGDFTLGDFWGVDAATLSTDVGEGVSLLLLNSTKAKALWSGLHETVGSVQRPWEEAVTGNPRLLSPTPQNPKRATFFAAYAAQPFEQVEAGYLALPALPYRMAAQVLTPEMKNLIRKVLK